MECSFFINSLSKLNKRKPTIVETTLQILLKVWRRQVVNNLFIFRESEKSLKETPLGLFSWWKVLRVWKESEKDSELWYWVLRVRSKYRNECLEAFSIFQKYKKFKNELPHRLYCSFMPLQDLKTTFSFPKYSKKWLL